jgi:hypothetical protein
MSLVSSSKPVRWDLDAAEEISQQSELAVMSGMKKMDDTWPFYWSIEMAR